jgi:hypothetical protein
MRFRSPRVTFEPEQSKVDSEWHVVAALSAIRARRVSKFKSKAEAEAWIKTESSAWLKKFEDGRYAAGSD